MFISTVSGNLVDAPESMQKGVRFKLAQNQRARDGAEHVHYVSCVNFQDGLKDILLQLQKGDPLTVNGRTTIAQNESNGKMYLNIDLIADNVTLPPKRQSDQQADAPAAGGSNFPFAQR